MRSGMKWKTSLVAAALALFVGQTLAQVPDIIIGAPNSMSGGYAEGGRQAVAGLKIAIDEIGSPWYADPTPYLRGKGAPGSRLSRPDGRV